MQHMNEKWHNPDISYLNLRPGAFVLNTGDFSLDQDYLCYE